MERFSQKWSNLSRMPRGLVHAAALSLALILFGCTTVSHRSYRDSRGDVFLDVRRKSRLKPTWRGTRSIWSSQGGGKDMSYLVFSAILVAVTPIALILDSLFSYERCHEFRGSLHVQIHDTEGKPLVNAKIRSSAGLLRTGQQGEVNIPFQLSQSGPYLQETCPSNDRYKMALTFFDANEFSPTEHQDVVLASPAKTTFKLTQDGNQVRFQRKDLVPKPKGKEPGKVEFEKVDRTALGGDITLIGTLRQQD